MKSKSIVTSLFAICLSVFIMTSTANAQSTSFGGKLGLNLANISDLPSGAEKSDMLLGFHVGGFANIGITENFSIQPEVLYSIKGSRDKYSLDFLGLSIDYDVKSALSYIEIPVMAMYSLDNGLNFSAGPYVGILASAKAKGEITALGIKEDIDEDIKDSFESLDFGIGLGIGYRMESGLGFGVRYTMGLANLVAEGEEIIDLGNGQTSTVKTDAYGKNSVIGISASWAFGGN